MLSHARQGLGLGLGLVFGGQVRIRVLSEYLCVFSVPPSDRNNDVLGYRKSRLGHNFVENVPSLRFSCSLQHFSYLRYSDLSHFPSVVSWYPGIVTWCSGMQRGSHR